MTRFAIDPATLVLLAEGNHQVGPGHQLVAPNSVRPLALDLLLRRVREGKLSEQRAIELLERMTEIKIRLLGDRVSRRTAWNFAVEMSRSSIQDAEYFAVAKLQADAIVTTDPKLIANAQGIVPLAKFTDVIVN